MSSLARYSEILLVAIGEVDDELLSYLELALPAVFNAPCTRVPDELQPDFS